MLCVCINMFSGDTSVCVCVCVCVCSSSSSGSSVVCVVGCVVLNGCGRILCSLDASVTGELTASEWGMEEIF